MCGKKALENYNEVYSQLDKTAVLLSSKHDDVFKNTNELLNKNKELQAQITQLKLKIFDMEINKIKESKNQFLIEENLMPNEMKMLCTKLQDKAEDVAGVFSKDNDVYRFQIMSKTTKLKEIAKELTKTYNGKGGRKRKLHTGTIIFR